MQSQSSPAPIPSSPPLPSPAPHHGVQHEVHLLVERQLGADKQRLLATAIATFNASRWCCSSFHGRHLAASHFGVRVDAEASTESSRDRRGKGAGLGSPQAG